MGNSWVVWDTSYLTKFFDFIKPAIGNAVVIGIIIFGVILGIMLVIRIVGMFTKG